MGFIRMGTRVEGSKFKVQSWGVSVREEFI